MFGCGITAKKHMVDFGILAIWNIGHRAWLTESCRSSTLTWHTLVSALSRTAARRKRRRSRSGENARQPGPADSCTGTVCSEVDRLKDTRTDTRQIASGSCVKLCVKCNWICSMRQGTSASGFGISFRSTQSNYMHTCKKSTTNIQKGVRCLALDLHE